MPIERLDPSRFWQFAIDHYRRPGVEHACLVLQDQYHGNVNLALLLHWLDTQSLALSTQEISVLLAALSASEPSLQAHRTQRRQLKPSLSKKLYRSLLDEELQLEQEQQQSLIDALSPMALSTTRHPRNLSNYCRLLAFPASLMPSLQAQERL